MPPDACAERDMICPSSIVGADGVTESAESAGLTVIVPVLDVPSPKFESVITTLYVLAPVAPPVIVRDGEISPTISTVPLVVLYHWYVSVPEPGVFVVRNVLD